MNWTIRKMKRMVNNDLVVEVTYRVVGKQEGLLADHQGKVTLEGDPQSEGFIPFAQLTEAQVVEWVKDSVDVTAIEAQVQAFLDAKITKKAEREVVSGLPWKK